MIKITEAEKERERERRESETEREILCNIFIYKDSNPIMKVPSL
jgi:hypothetical protein